VAGAERERREPVRVIAQLLEHVRDGVRGKVRRAGLILNIIVANDVEQPSLRRVEEMVEVTIHVPARTETAQQLLSETGRGIITALYTSDWQLAVAVMADVPSTRGTLRLPPLSTDATIWVR
jgi:hypothetical protein